MGWPTRSLRVAGLLVFLTSLGPAALQEANCTTPDKFVSFQPTNASRLEEAKYRSKDDQRLNKHLEDRDFDKRFDDELEEEGSSLELKVRPLNSKVDDEHPSRQSVERGEEMKHRNRYQDKKKVNRYDDERQSSRNFEDQQSIKRLNDQHESRNYEDEYPTYHYDDHLTRPVNNQHPNRNLDDERPFRHYDGEEPNRHFDEHPMRPNDDQRSTKNPEVERPFRHYDDDHREDENFIDDKYYNKNTHDQNSYRNLDGRVKIDPDNEYQSTDHPKQDLDRHPVNQYPDTRLNDRNSNRRLDDLHPDVGMKNQNFERHIVDQHPDRQPINKYRDESQPNKYRDDLKPKYRNDLSSNRRVDDPKYERRLEEPLPDIEDQHPNRRPEKEHPSKNPNDLHFNKKVDDKHIDDRIPNRKSDDPNFERRVVESSSDRHLDDLHPDQQINEQNFERRLVDQPPERHVGVDVRPDRRISDEKFDQRIVDQNPEDRPHPENNGLYPEQRLEDKKVLFIDDTTLSPRKESNISHLMTFNLPKDWDESKPKLDFPKKYGEERYRMATLHLDKGLFAFDFLRHFLSIIQPRDFPLDLLKDTIEGRVNISTLIKQSIHVELVFIALISVFAVLMFVVPGTECWLCCRPRQYNYQRRRHGTLVFFLCMYAMIIGACVVTMLICNEEVAGGIERIPETMEAALEDLRDYHAGTAVQLRKCLTRSLDVASEAVLADLDNVEDLLGKPVQEQLSSETGVDVALEALMDVANATTELAYKTDALLKRAERAREFGAELSREADEIRRDLERTSRDCSPEDRSLCAVLDPSGLHLALRLERVARDDRLLRLRQAGRENLTEAGRQARGEYLYVPHHVARTTLEARNQIRREINTARAKVSDEARSIEASGSDLSNQLDTVRRLNGQIQPYVRSFEYTMWYVGFGTAMCVLLIWLLLFGALCCRCGSSENRVRPTLLWFAFFGCLVSMGLWVVLTMTLAIASHAEMLLCRPLDDPEYRTVEAVLETRAFLGRRLSVPLKDLFDRKCDQHDSAYPAFQLDNSLKLEQLTAHWTWTHLTRAFAKLKVDLTSLRILSPNLRERLQNLLYASGPNLTEHRIMIQGPILNKDLNALSDQVENVARQLKDRRTARSFQTLGAQMRDLLSRRVKPLMKMQDELVYQLATLELHLQPLQQQVNQTLSHLRNVQYFIDSQGEKIAQLKTKAYVDRLGYYLDQWRAHVLTEMSSGVAKCRPLWDILQGIKLLVCSHILGPLNGFWFATLICVVTMLVCIPSAHSLASTYWRQPSSKGSVLLSSRQGTPDTVVMARETWRTPDPPPSMDSW
ncbi:prominin-1 isoform X1 [Nasonia vitripennis]|uniref:Prominin-like protein n=1 Tax=Nasonia vitripennis TaxID=7425 RepID=A0A7M7M2S4_NASVI|nr:prominin-1 isoform X1 [Nasonia vitripennis]